MKKLLFVFMVLGLCSVLAASGWADTLELKDGRLLEGKYMGGTQQTIRFQAENKIVVYRVSDVLALTFSSSVSALPTPTPASRQPGEVVSYSTPQPRPNELVLASGTKLFVSMLHTVNLRTSKQDDWFSGLLTKNVVVNDETVIPKDTKVHGQVVTVQEDRSVARLAIELRELEIKGKIIPVSTKPYVAEAKAQTLVGSNALKIVTRPRTVQIPFRSVVEFELSRPVKLTK